MFYVHMGAICTYVHMYMNYIHHIYVRSLWAHQCPGVCAPPVLKVSCELHGNGVPVLQSTSHGVPLPFHDLVSAKRQPLVRLPLYQANDVARFVAAQTTWSRDLRLAENALDRLYDLCQLLEQDAAEAAAGSTQGRAQAQKQGQARRAQARRARSTSRPSDGLETRR